MQALGHKPFIQAEQIEDVKKLPPEFVLRNWQMFYADRQTLRVRGVLFLHSTTVTGQRMTSKAAKVAVPG